MDMVGIPRAWINIMLYSFQITILTLNVNMLA